MWSDYFFYLMGLPEKERNVQILVIVGVWIIMLIIGYLYEYINTKLKKKLVIKIFNLLFFF